MICPPHHRTGTVVVQNLAPRVNQAQVEKRLCSNLRKTKAEVIYICLSIFVFLQLYGFNKA